MKTAYESIIQNLGFELERKEQDFWFFTSKQGNLLLFMEMETTEKTVFFRGNTWTLEELKLLAQNNENPIPPFGIASFTSPISILKAASLCYGLVKSEFGSSYYLPNKIFKSKTFNQVAIPLFDSEKFENLILLDPDKNTFSMAEKSKKGFLKNVIGRPEKCLFTLDPFSFLNFHKGGNDNAFIALINPNANGDYLVTILDSFKKEGFTNIDYLIHDSLDGYISYLLFLTKIVNFIGNGDCYISLDCSDKSLSFSLCYNSVKVSIKSVGFFNELKSSLDNTLETNMETYGHQQRKMLVLNIPYHQDLVIETCRKIRSFFGIEVLPFVLETQHV